MFRQFARLLLLFLEAVASLNCMPMMNLQTHLKDFRVDRSLFAMLGIHVLTMTISVEIQYHVPVFTLLIGTVYGPVLAATIVLHEFAQAATKRYFRQQPKDSPYSPVHEELCCTIAGPLSHIPQGLFWLGLYVKLSAGDYYKLNALEIDMDSLKEGGAIAFVSTLAMQAFVMNVVMLKLNLIIPVHPFPGARVLVALLVLCGSSLYTAGLVTSVLGIVMGLLAFWTGLFLFFMSYNVIAFCFGALACFTIFSGARLLRMTLSENVQDHLLFQRPCYKSDYERRRRRKEVSFEEEKSVSVVV